MPVDATETKTRIIVAMSGASGAVYGIRLLECLRNNDQVETHLIMSKAGAATITSETDSSPRQVEELADVYHKQHDIGASIASGSFRTAGMIIAPCSIKTLSAVANSYDADLISRGADVTLKEGRPLILMLRETPFHLGHIRLMEQAALAGAIIAPPIPAFYHRPQTLAEIIDHSIDRVLQRIGLPPTSTREWLGLAHGYEDSKLVYDHSSLCTNSGVGRREP